MDNLTHTLIGVLIGETAARTTRPTPDGLEPQRRRNLLVTTAAIASNLPDLDFIHSAITGDKLQYLMEHRGRTHTLIGIVLIAALVVTAVELWARWRNWRLSGRDRMQLIAVTLAALLLHLGMDFTNNYGVHPFWPAYEGWFYGDTIFIWEPLLWVAAAPLVFLLKSKVARTLVAALLATALAVCLTSGLVPVASGVFMAAMTAALLWIARHAPPRTALSAGIAVWLSITCLFAIARSVAHSQIQAFVGQRMSDANVLDYVLTPMPGNPVCWDVMLPMIEGEQYIVRHGSWSLLPGLIAGAECPGRALFNDITAPLSPIDDLPTRSAMWYGSVAMPRGQIAKIARADCVAAEFMKFARVPWSMRRDNHWIVGDLRYDRERELGFAELELPADANCPRPAPWLPPRADLLTQP